MKYQLLFLTLLALVLGMDSFDSNHSQAKPAPVFQPIIQDIRNRLPTELEMRLPASLPSFTKDLTLYSFVIDDSKISISFDDLELEFFTVLVADTPNCSQQKNPLDCSIAIIGVTEDPIKSKTQLDTLLSDNEELAPVKFGQGIEGLYFVEEDFQLIIWRQNKLAHLLVTEKCSHDCVSKQQLIEMAKSAANEPAIIHSDSYIY